VKLQDYGISLVGAVTAEERKLARPPALSEDVLPVFRQRDPLELAGRCWDSGAVFAAKP